MSQGVGDWGAHLAAPTAHRGERAPNVPPGESVDDCGGGYSESIAEICEELQNGLTPLLIVTPNGRDESGANRDCYLFSPAARAPVHTNMFRFLGARGMGHRGRGGARSVCAAGRAVAGAAGQSQGPVLGWPPSLRCHHRRTVLAVAGSGHGSVHEPETWPLETERKRAQDTTGVLSLGVRQGWCGGLEVRQSQSAWWCWRTRGAVAG